ncbi:MAG: polyprenyl synthetase family protein [Candidatus Nanohaloarchaea archaeon]
MSSQSFQETLSEERLKIDGDIEVFFERVIDDTEEFLNVEKHVDGDELLKTGKDGEYLGENFTEFFQDLEEYIMRGGKRFRPAATLWSYRAFGGELSRKELSPVYLTTELYHNSTLIHDDIMDQDDMRRGGDTWHVKQRNELEGRSAEEPVRGEGWTVDSLPRIEMVSIGEAIDAGNVLEDLARKTVMETPLPREKLYNVIEILTDTDMRVNSGQNSDLEMELLSIQEIARHEIETSPEMNDPGKPRVEGLYEDLAGDFDSWTDAYLNMIDRKTGDLYEACVRIGAELADATEEQENRMVAAMRRMSRAFQIQDDYLELEQSAEETGKEPTDVINGKLTLASISAYENMNSALQILDEAEEAARRHGVYQDNVEGTVGNPGTGLSELFERGGQPLEHLLEQVDVERYVEGVEDDITGSSWEKLLRGRERIRRDREEFLELYGNVDDRSELETVRDIVLDYSTAKEEARNQVREAKRILEEAELREEYADRFLGFADYMLERSH